jgi:hypothetical protein
MQTLVDDAQAAERAGIVACVSQGRKRLAYARLGDLNVDHDLLAWSLSAAAEGPGACGW